MASVADLPSKLTAAERTKSQAVNFMSVKELRKVLGKNADGIDDRHLLEVSVAIGKISLMMTTNPELIEKITKSYNAKKG
ncbi:hypothetical protein IJH97_00810 [Candidatus Saccharibacteria bacterium]|nr:hypothetical protein [Candidatus Saccharibacteria bacterium]